MSLLNVHKQQYAFCKVKKPTDNTSFQLVKSASKKYISSELFSVEIWSKLKIIMQMLNNQRRTLIKTWTIQVDPLQDFLHFFRGFLPLYAVFDKTHSIIVELKLQYLFSWNSIWLQIKHVCTSQYLLASTIHMIYSDIHIYICLCQYTVGYVFMHGFCRYDSFSGFSAKLTG